MNYSPEILSDFARLSPAAQKILALEVSGVGPSEISRQASIPRSTITRARAKPLYREVLLAMRAADSEAILTGMDRARELAQAGLIHSLEMAMAELTGEDKWQAMNFLERVAERVIVGYGSVGPGGKVVAAAPGEEPGALVKIYLPSNDRPANPSPANDSIEIDVSKFPSAD